ncbi:MAG TPA: 30S ribosomal protein S4 [Spirochaetaceae bacterium]|nr:30S ribosomal protein S4 [Spirochaetaceae bacterium]
MARYTGPKCRYCRAEQTQLYLKGDRCSSGKCPLKSESGKRTAAPGKDPKVRGRKNTDYGLQLREKQKLKRMYGMLEKQFHITFEKATKMSGVTGQNMINLLERRLDNVVYRLHFAKSRSQASQIVCHGHVMVNGRVVNIPSYQLKDGDSISIRPQSRESKLFRENLSGLSKRENNTVSWLSLDVDAMSGKFVSNPVRSEIHDLQNVNEQLIVELYSK